jgi:hypothetical protein
MKMVAIVQSNYIPWKGYFDLINSSDEFVLYGDLQYAKNDWKDANRIKAQSVLPRVPISVNYKHSRAKDTMIGDSGGNSEHRT